MSAVVDPRTLQEIPTIRTAPLAIASFLVLTTSCTDAAKLTKPADDSRIGVRSDYGTGIDYSVKITPAPLYMWPTQSIQLTATVCDPYGKAVPGESVTWTSDNTRLFSVNGNGLVTAAFRQGSATVQVNVDGRSATAQVNVGAVKGTPNVDRDTSCPQPTAVAPPPPPPPVVTPPPPPSNEPPPLVGGLYNDYNPTSVPHFQHISMMVTEWRIAGEPFLRAGEYGWTLSHYDHFIGGRTQDIKTRMPSASNIDYVVYLSVIQPNTGERDQLGSAYYNDMAAWYAQHPQYNFESAFVHNRGGGVSQSNRLVGTTWGSPRWFINIGDAGARAYQSDRMARYIQSSGMSSDGIFVDEHDGGNIAKLYPSLEFSNYDAIQPAVVGMLQAIRGALGGRMVMINTAESASSYSMAQIAAAGAAHTEQMNNPLREIIPRWDQIEQMLAMGVTVQLVPGFTDDEYNTALPGWTAGNEATPAKRGRMFELASYYTVLNSPRTLWLTTYNGQWGTVPYVDNWIKAIEANLGAPEAPRSRYSSGTDGVGRPYEIWQRPYNRALILTRPQFSWAYTRYDDATAVTVQLPGGETWRVLRADGSVSGAVTSVTLRNAEAVILIKASVLS